MFYCYYSAVVYAVADNYLFAAFAFVLLDFPIVFADVVVVIVVCCCLLFVGVVVVVVVVVASVVHFHQLVSVVVFVIGVARLVVVDDY